MAAEWMGWENVFHCEWNTFGQKVLKYYWPKSITYNDITQTDFSIHRGKIDILTGGFPCQPYSTAGKRLGKGDSRHLWPEMLRAIREIEPRWIVGENVRGLISWNGGMVFDEVQSDLEAAGYSVRSFVLPAAGVNAPHRRDRIWFVAHAIGTRAGDKLGESCRQRWESCENRDESIYKNREAGSSGHNTTSANAFKDTISDGRLLGESIEEGAEVWQQRDLGAGDTERICGEKMAGIATNTEQPGLQGQHRDRKACSEHRVSEGVFVGSENKLNAADADNTGLQGGEVFGGVGSSGADGNQFASGRVPPNWEEFPTQSPVRFGDDGIPERLDSITFPKWRNESIKAARNAIVPQVVHQIFKSIQEYESIENARVNR